MNTGLNNWVPVSAFEYHAQLVQCFASICQQRNTKHTHTHTNAYSDIHIVRANFTRNIISIKILSWSWELNQEKDKH